MQKKKIISNPDYIDLQIKLKSCCGMKPGIYLAVLYLSILLLLFFIVFFIPGIINKGTRVFYSSTPTGASVWVNGEYAGSTPFKSFLEEGLNEITIRKPGFNDYGEIIENKGYIFATIFKKPELIINKKLEISGYRELYDWVISDYLKWCSIEDFHESYQPENMISKTLEMLENGGRETSETYLFLEKCFKNITRDYLLGDFIKGLIIYTNSNNPLLPGDLLDLSVFASNEFTSNPAVLLHLLSILSNSKYSDLLKLSELDVVLKSIEEKRVKFQLISENKPVADNKNMLTLLNKNYVMIPSGNYQLGNIKSEKNEIAYDSAPAPKISIRIEKFYMASDKVSNIDYLEFLEENPYWNKSNKVLLIEKSLADDNYLEHWPENLPLKTDMARPVSNVSFFAAEAYSNWITAKIKKTNPDLKAFIPDEYMWETAEKIEGKNLNLMNNYLWDWCSNWFNTADYINPERYNDLDQNRVLKGIEKSVRGGSMINSPDDVYSWTRASQPPEWCTPFTGFRIALISEKK